ncbi:hypothetical protein ABPG72_012950 [Tetrahymena utriculariae]
MSTFSINGFSNQSYYSEFNQQNFTNTESLSVIFPNQFRVFGYKIQHHVQQNYQELVISQVYSKAILIKCQCAQRDIKSLINEILTIDKIELYEKKSVKNNRKLIRANSQTQLSLSSLCKIPKQKKKINSKNTQGASLDVLNFVISRELLDQNKEQQLYIISILFNVYQDYGWLSGPLIGGVMTNYLDFRRASFMIGLINLSYTVLYLICFKLPLISTIFPEKQNQLQTKQEQVIPTFSSIQQVENKHNKQYQANTFEPSVSDRSIQNQHSQHQERQNDEKVIFEGYKDQHFNEDRKPDLNIEENFSPTILFRNSS